MSNPRTDREAVIQAIQAAKKVHLDGTPIGGGGWVDVFGAILRANLALMFKPLNGLYGAYLPAKGERQAGVLVNSNHPLALQRYTAAHEFGHHRMDHSPSIDGEEEIMPRERQKRRAPREVAAETFAAFYLMPLKLLSQRMAAMGLDRSKLTDPAAVYALSLSFGVSYSAMVRHLFEARHVTQETMSILAEVAPKSVKQALMGGAALEDAHSDVREIDGLPKEIVTVREGDTLILTLPSHAAGGYEWHLDSPTDNSLTAQAAPLVLGPPSEEVGVSRDERLVLRCISPGLRKATLAERRPWEPAGAVLNSLALSVEVLGRPLGLYRRELATA